MASASSVRKHRMRQDQDNPGPAPRHSRSLPSGTQTDDDRRESSEGGSPLVDAAPRHDHHTFRSGARSVMFLNRTRHDRAGARQGEEPLPPDDVSDDKILHMIDVLSHVAGTVHGQSLLLLLLPFRPPPAARPSWLGPYGARCPPAVILSHRQASSDHSS